MFNAVFGNEQQLVATMDELDEKFHATMGELDEKFYALFEENETFNAEFTETIGCHETIYDGSTVVIPKAFQQQSLDTSDKIVLDDITVLEIPYTEVSNLSDGLTVIIG